MKQALWNGRVLAESDKTVRVEGNAYFPVSSLRKEYFQESSTHTHCAWKGQASYYTLTVDGKENPDAAWYYPSTSNAAKHIEGMVAFWKGVEVKDAG